jgi:O-antigen/teichoic acid export membrane protein
MKNQLFSAAFFMGSGIGISFNAVYDLPITFYSRIRNDEIPLKYLLFLALTPGILSSQFVLNAIKNENIEFGVYLMSMQASICFVALAIWVNDFQRGFFESQSMGNFKRRD